MTLQSTPRPGDWRRVEVTRGDRTHGGWWRPLGEQVHLESEYGNANRKIEGRQPEELAAELLDDLVKRRGA